MIKKIHVFILILCCGFAHRAAAQLWDSLGPGLQGGTPYCMYADSVDNYLYVGGYFTNSGSTLVGGLVRWDGSTFDPMVYTGNRYAHAITRYQGDIYVAGLFWSIGDQHIAKWNGSSWDSVGRVYGGAVFKFLEFNNDLYVVGTYDSIRGIQGNNIAKWNGTSWSNLKDTTFTSQIIAVAAYNNELYIAGNFIDAASNVWRVAKWNGTNFVPVGNGGIYGGWAFVQDMIVYNNELYVGGYFKKSDGNTGNFIQKWDGSNWSEVGGGMTGSFGTNGQINDLEVYGGELYAVGSFDKAGGVPAYFVAKWDGTDWCGFGSYFDNILTAIAFKNGEMYVGGGFDSINVDSITRVAKWIGTAVDTCGHINLGVENIVSETEIRVYPNPASNYLILESETDIEGELKIFNVLGEVTKVETVEPSKGQRLDITDLSPGIYILRLGPNSFAKFIKQ